MRLPSKALLVCMTVPALLALGASRNAHADAWTDGAGHPAQCEQNPHITPSLQVCAFQREGVRHYRIDTQDGRHVRLAIVNGDVEVLPVGDETVRIALSGTGSHASGVETMVYRDATLELDEMRGPRNQLVWVVHPLTPAAPAQNMCRGEGCSGNGKGIQSK